jgi:hypothetical protein
LTIESKCSFVKCLKISSIKESKNQVDVWVGDIIQGGDQPEISVAKEIAKFEREGHQKIL